MNKFVKDFNAFKMFESGVSQEDAKDKIKEIKDSLKDMETHIKDKKKKFVVSVEVNDTKAGRAYTVNLQNDSVKFKSNDEFKDGVTAELMKAIKKYDEKPKFDSDYSRITFKFVEKK